MRIDVPKFAMKEITFEDANKDDIEQCFYALNVFTEFANMLASAADVTS